MNASGRMRLIAGLADIQAVVDRVATARDALGPSGDVRAGLLDSIAEIFPETREQRCWVHKTANILDALPKSAQPAATRPIQDIYNVGDKGQARMAVKAFPRSTARNTRRSSSG